MEGQVIEVEPEIVQEFARYCFKDFKNLDNEDSFIKQLAQSALFYFRRGWYAALQRSKGSAE